MSKHRPPKTRSRRGAGPYLVPGERAVDVILASAPQRVKHIVVEGDREFGALAVAQHHGIEVLRWNKDRIAARFPDVDVRGIVAVAQPPAMLALDELVDKMHSEAIPGRRSMLVALDGVLDPQNLGAIMRSCEFFGATGLLWTKDRAASLGPAVVRASAGASERLPLCVVTNLAQTLLTLQRSDLWVLGTVPEGGRDLGPGGTELPDRVVVVMGGEQRGLRRLTKERCDELVTIPRRGALASLNVSAAAAVTLAFVSAAHSG